LFDDLVVDLFGSYKKGNDCFRRRIGRGRRLNTLGAVIV
jgi:hypothetical protein